jgi:hypothetical protein
MLVKINGILMSQAPDAGGEGGSAGGASADAGTESGGQESGGQEGDESGDEGGDTGGEASGDSGGEFNNDFDFDAFLEFDPFANPTGVRGGDNKSGEEGGDKAAAEGGKPAPSQQQQKPAAGQEGKKDEGQGGDKPAAETNPELELLRQQNQQLMQALSQIQKPADAAAAAATGQQGGQAPTAKTPEQVRQERHERVAKSLPQYQFQIPQEVMEKMGSDDPNQIRAGLSEFATGVASVAHYNVAMQFEERIAELEKQLLEKSVQQFRQTTQAEEAAKQTQKTVFDDFYGKYPELNKPGLQEFVQMQAQQLAKQYGVTGWSEQFRDTLGAHCKKLLGLGSGQGPSPDAGQGTKNGGQKPAGTRFNSGGGNGGGNGGGRQQGSLGDEIADTLLT